MHWPYNGCMNCAWYLAPRKLRSSLHRVLEFQFGVKAYNYSKRHGKMLFSATYCAVGTVQTSQRNEK